MHDATDDPYGDESELTAVINGLSGDNFTLTNSRNSQPSYSPQVANASLKARSPGAPFSMAMMARRWLT